MTKRAMTPVESDAPYTLLATTQPSVAPVAVAFHFFSYLLGLLTALTLVGGSVWLLRRPAPAPIVLHPPPTAAPTATLAPTATPAPMIVFVSGAVLHPGIYSLDATARVADAIRAAGGVTSEANAAIVNQAEPLWDGVQVHVPSLPAPVAANTLIDPAANTLINPAANSVVQEPPSGVSGLAPVVAVDGVSSGQGGGLINVNQATASELETLPGIGPAKAAAIIANRPYATVEDLERVPGIGARTMDQLRALVTVQ